VYTCPKCRETILNKPVEVYALKTLVQAIAKAQGETTPKKDAPPANKSKVKAKAAGAGPWDNFFPRQS
jgi:hypothetical protein